MFGNAKQSFSDCMVFIFWILFCASRSHIILTDFDFRCHFVESPRLFSNSMLETREFVNTLESNGNFIPSPVHAIWTANYIVVSFPLSHRIKWSFEFWSIHSSKQILLFFSLVLLCQWQKRHLSNDYQVIHAFHSTLYDIGKYLMTHFKNVCLRMNWTHFDRIYFCFVWHFR